jgi:hypothetical protein
MYDFAIVALLALATVKLVDFLADNVPMLDRLRSLVTFAGALGAVWILDYSLFDGFGVDVRNHDAGIWMTGLVVAGLTVPWRALFGFLTHDRATVDETLGHHVSIRKVA